MFSDDLLSPRADAIMGVLWSLAIIATVMIGIRIQIVVHGNGQAVWALIWAVASWIIGVASQALLTLSFKNGMGGHIADAEAHGDVLNAIKWGWISSSINLIGIALGKWAVIAFLLAIHGPTHQRSKIMLVILAGINMALDVSLCFVIMFQCSPPAAIWDFSPEMQARARCSSADIQRDLGFTTAAINAATDFVLAVYPVFLLRNSQTIAVRRKVTICLLMSAGAIAGASGIAKAYQIQSVETSHDQTWDTALLWVWTWAELWVILIAACVPALAPHFSQMFCCGGSRGRRASIRADPQHTRESWFGLAPINLADVNALGREDLNDDAASPDSELPQSSIDLDALSVDRRPPTRGWYGQHEDVEDSASGEAEVGLADDQAKESPLKEGIRMQKDVSVDYEPAVKGEWEGSRGRGTAW